MVAVSLKKGLEFSAGTLAGGPPTDAKSFTFTIRATDANGLYAELTDTVVIRYASYVRWRRQTANNAFLYVSSDGRNAQSLFDLNEQTVRSDTWLQDGKYYWEGSSGFANIPVSNFSLVAAIIRDDGVTTEVGNLVRHTDNSGGPGVASGALLIESPKNIVSSWPNLRGDSDAIPFRVRNRASKEVGGWKWEIALEDQPWVTLAEDLPGDFGFSCISRGNIGSLPQSVVRTATIYSEPETFKYDVPDGFIPAAAAAVPYTAADAPQLEEAYAHTGNSNPQTVPLPETVNEGDLLIVHLTYHLNATAGNLSPPAGWEELREEGVGGTRFIRLLAKIADGDEGGTSLSVPTGSRFGPYIAVVRRYAAGTFTGLPSVAFVKSTSGETIYETPPTLTPAWGQDPAIYVTTFSGFNPQTFGPMPYPDYQQTETNGDLCVADCQTFAEVVGTEVPSLFELSSPDVTAWAHTLIGIEPGAPQ